MRGLSIPLSHEDALVSMI